MADTTSDRLVIWNGAWRNIAEVRVIRLNVWAGEIEVVAKLEVDSVQEARALERKLKSFKSPVKALRHLEILGDR